MIGIDGAIGEMEGLFHRKCTYYFIDSDLYLTQTHNLVLKVTESLTPAGVARKRGAPAPGDTILG